MPVLLGQHLTGVREQPDLDASMFNAMLLSLHRAPFAAGICGASIHSQSGTAASGLSKQGLNELV